MIWMPLILSAYAFTSPAHATGPEQRIERAKRQLEQISRAVDAYFVDCSEFPRRLTDLYTPVRKCKQWGPDPYLNSGLIDPWGYPVDYRRPTWNTYSLRSLGRDHREGGVGEDMDIAVEMK